MAARGLPQDHPVPPGYAAGAPVPWWVKFGVKLAIGALPVPPRAWRALGLRRHSFGAGDDAMLLAPLQGWVDQFRAVAGRTPRSLLEVGPGAMVLRAPAAAALGFGPIWFLDVEDDAPRDLAPYRRAADAARAAGLPAPDLSGCATHLDVLAACNARLLIGGAARLGEVPDRSVDLVTSSAVLEHVRRDEMQPLLRALHRVAAPDGIGLHGIDLHDHLGGRLRHLSFSPEFWEGQAIAKAALYCNRLGLSEILDAMQAAGFAAEVLSRLVWSDPPLPPRGMHPHLTRRAEDNRVCAANLLCRMA
jgi:SAM-dependent methyltransferase